MKINELSDGMNNVEITAEVSEVMEPREVMTKFGTTVKLTEIILKDDSGEVKLTLWGDKADGVEAGKSLELKGAFVKNFRDTPQLGIGKTGSIKVL